MNPIERRRRVREAVTRASMFGPKEAPMTPTADPRVARAVVKAPETTALTVCSECGTFWQTHPSVELPNGGASTACPGARAVRVVYHRQDVIEEQDRVIEVLRRRVADGGAIA